MPTMMEPNRGTILQRYLAEGDWIAESAFHPGGGDVADNGADNAVYRARNGDFVMAGSSLASATFAA